MRNLDLKKYAHTGINELNKEFTTELGNGIFDLTTNEEMGMFLDRSLHAQDIFIKRIEIEQSLNYEYVLMNDRIESLNAGRCIIYKPLKWKPYREWYQDDLLFEKDEEHTR